MKRFFLGTSKALFRFRFSTFVSQHYKLNQRDLTDFLDLNKLTHKLIGSEVVIKECPFCHDTKGLPSNHWKLNIHKDSGAFNCFRCGSKGSWYDFKLNFRNSENNVVKLVNTKNLAPEIIQSFTINKQVIEYLAKRGLTAETALKYGVGGTTCQFMGDNGEWSSHSCITFPLKIGSKIVRQKDPLHFSKRTSKVGPSWRKVGTFWYGSGTPRCQGDHHDRGRI